MNIIRSILGYTVAVFCVLFAMATFVSNFQISRSFLTSTGLSISPWLIGGEAIRTIDRTDVQTIIHEAVFNGLIGERDSGFIQIDWKSKTDLPGIIKDSIDYNGDDVTDFNIVYDTKDDVADVTSDLFELDGRVDTFKRDHGVTIRIWIQNPNS